MTQQRGKFISFEGIDGAGKSTHIGFTADYLRKRGLELVSTREPGGTPLGESLRDLLLRDAMDHDTETLLLFAARREHVEHVVRPALRRWCSPVVGIQRCAGAVIRSRLSLTINFLKDKYVPKIIRAGTAQSHASRNGRI